MSEILTSDELSCILSCGSEDDPLRRLYLLEVLSSCILIFFDVPVVCTAAFLCLFSATPSFDLHSNVPLWFDFRREISRKSRFYFFFFFFYTSALNEQI